MSDNQLYENIHNFTRFKIIEMLIEKYKDSKLDTLDIMEELSEDILTVLTIAGLKYYNELKGDFE
tara:strand:+ start:363 stop:557 length:195 start_codon:yes stop_codon:yes gene_type:complete